MVLRRQRLDKGMRVDLNGKYYIPFNMYYKHLNDEDFTIVFTEKGKNSFTYDLLTELGVKPSLAHMNISGYKHLPEFGVLDTENDVLDLYYKDGTLTNYTILTYRGEELLINGDFDIAYMNRDNEFEYYYGKANRYEIKMHFIKLMKVIQRGVFRFEM